MISTTRLLDTGWTFTQIGGGHGTENDEWLETSTFPTSVHVELIHLKKIPDPVSTASTRWKFFDLFGSSLVFMNGMYSVRTTF